MQTAVYLAPRSTDESVGNTGAERATWGDIHDRQQRTT